MSLYFEWVLPIEFVALCYLIYLIEIVVLVRYLCKYTKYKSTIYISKRHPYVSSIAIICVICAIVLNFCVITFYRSISESSALYSILWNVCIVAQPITVYGVFHCLVWRAWHFYYDSMLNIHLDQQWKTIIDPCFQSKQQNNWYLNHKTTFGSTTFIAKRVFLLYTISCIISIVIWFLDHVIGYHIAMLVDFVDFYLAFVLFLILYHKTPKFGDELHISDEMRRIQITVIMSSVSYLTLVGLSAVLGHHHIFAIIMCQTSSFMMFIVAMINTKWVLDHLPMWLQHTSNTISDAPDTDRLPARLKLFVDSSEVTMQSIKQMKSMSETSTVNSATSEYQIAIQSKNVIEVLQKEQTFDAFIIHLNAEYSLECMLSFIEIMQFQQYLMRNREQLKRPKAENDTTDIVFDSEDVFADKMIDIGFKDHVPKSQIVFADDVEAECAIMKAKHKAHGLYRKYIVEGAPYEVNISYTVRARFTNLMHDYDFWMNTNDEEDLIVAHVDGDVLLSMFNRISNEMYQLLSFSLSRFKSTLKKQSNPL